MPDGDWKQRYAALRLREIKHRFTYKKINDRMAQALLRYKTCENKKNMRQIAREIDLCRRFWRCYPLHYFRYNHYREQSRLSDIELRDYIPDFFFYTLFLPHYDGDEYAPLLEDKVVADSLFRSLDIPTPRSLGAIVRGRLYDGCFSPETAEAVTEEAAASGAGKIFVKPAYGSGGHGIIVFTRDEEGCYRDKNGGELGGFLSRDVLRGDYILQAGLVQHRSLSAVYPNSVNTYRIATENIGGSVRAVCSVIRFGCGGREVDNVCQGGIVLKVDGSTGKTADFGITETGEKYSAHPDTGFRFSRFSNGGWEAVLRFALDCAAKLPWFTYLGWDIALTGAGPVAIEANLGFGLDLFQVAHGGLREAFRIGDPDYYWKYAGKRAELPCRRKEIL